MASTIKSLANVLGPKATVGLVAFFFGEEGALDIAQDLDKQDLLELVMNEKNAKLGLQQSAVLLGTLKTARDKMMADGAKLAKKYGPTSAEFLTSVAAVTDINKSIAKLELSVAAITKGSEAASRWVDKAQLQVSINLVDDQVTLSTSAINDIVNNQIQFTQDMIAELPKTKIGSKLRDSVKKKVADESASNAIELDIMTRMATNSLGADGPTEATETTEYAEMLKLAGIEPEVKQD